MNVTQLNATFDDNQTYQQSHVNNHYLPPFFWLRKPIWYIAMTLGIPGNILSMIVWMRHQVVGKNSSAVYLTAMAINDLISLVVVPLEQAFHICTDNSMYAVVVWLCYVQDYVADINSFLEPLLVLAFSVERLIAIWRPLQVGLCCMCFDMYLSTALAAVNILKSLRYNPYVSE